MRSGIPFAACSCARRRICGRGPAARQQKVKIGFIITFSGPQGVMGQFRRNRSSCDEHLAARSGGLRRWSTADRVKPDVGVQVAETMLKKQQVVSSPASSGRT